MRRGKEQARRTGTATARNEAAKKNEVRRDLLGEDGTTVDAALPGVFLLLHRVHVVLVQPGFVLIQMWDKIAG